jgi:ornithine cyclodeaminase/alanine dehydrogenase-like protein (mu-crystallin family)
VNLRVLSHADVVKLLPLEECIPVMAAALAELARGRASQPLRTALRPPGIPGLMALMPAYRAPLFGLKAVCVFPENVLHGLDAHQGCVLLFSGETGEPLALANASAITAVRTAAVSAVATRVLARQDAGDLALVGTGVQARAHLTAMALVRRLRRVRVASRTLEHAERFAASCPFPVQAVESVEAALVGADLIVTATTAREPILRREWITPGAHLNAVGSSIPTTRELDGATLAAGSLFVDRRESTLNESGDYLFALREGVVGPEHIRAEIGEVLLGDKPGRTSEDEITIFKSLGLAIEDLAAAEHVFTRATKEAVGTVVGF